MFVHTKSSFSAQRNKALRQAFLTAILMTVPSVAVAEFRIGLPVDCQLGKDCFVQNYVDLDPGEEARDVLCGAATYDGHKGTDFRSLNTKVEMDVLASANGVVKALRDGEPDRLVTNAEERAAVSGKECGNGVVIAHQDGWETQYCHLRMGSVAVRQGQEVTVGQKIGTVGYSGLAAFPHVHLSVRRKGAVVDPFIGQAVNPAEAMAACSVAGGRSVSPDTSLWPDLSAKLLADARGVVIETGFSDRPLASLDLEKGTVREPGRDASALVFFTRLINLAQGDLVRLEVTGPGGFSVENTGEPMDRSKAQWVAFAGKRLTAAAWPAGAYTGKVSLIRNGQTIQEAKAAFDMQ
ncbi:M23 family metallopeptidase [Roseibium denhamense]|uniref:Peptidase family M23 n=1 Tax=Roseibium denhamense TaxID=76305 RepID=A0ABY1NSN7_9HYPH|nr:Peptidase family M23 [Roseibium denhamense]